jgi:hypothetical protein
MSNTLDSGGGPFRAATTAPNSKMFRREIMNRGCRALRGARKLARGLRQGLSEAERYRVADDVVHRLQQNGDPWRLSEDLPPPGKGHSTPT